MEHPKMRLSHLVVQASTGEAFSGFMPGTLNGECQTFLPSGFEMIQGPIEGVWNLEVWNIDATSESLNTWVKAEALRRTMFSRWIDLTMSMCLSRHLIFLLSIGFNFVRQFCPNPSWYTTVGLASRQWMCADGKRCVVPCCPYQNSTHLKGPGCLNLGQLRNWHCMDAGFSDTGNHESLCVGMLKGWDMLKLFQYYLQALIPWHLMTSSSQCSALVKFYWIKDLPEAEAVLLESNSELSCHSCHTSCRGFVTKTPAARNNLVAWVFRTSQLKTPIAVNRNFLKEVKGWDVGRIQRWLVADWSSCGPGW